MVVRRPVVALPVAYCPEATWGASAAVARSSECRAWRRRLYRRRRFWAAFEAQNVLKRHLAVAHEQYGLKELEVLLNVAVRLLAHQLPRGHALRAMRVEHVRPHQHACITTRH